MPLIPAEAPILPGFVTRRRAVAAAGAAVAIAASWFGGAASAAPPPEVGKPSPRWMLELATRYFPPPTSRSEFISVLATGRIGWFFGGSNFAGSGTPEIEQRKDGGWQSQTLPPRLRSWISGASADSASDIWAVTYLGGTVLHWNGSIWTVHPRGHWDINAQFTGIVAFSPSNVWLFGARGPKHRGAGTWHLTGTTWTEIRGQAGDIDQASATRPSDMWAIGGLGGSLNAIFRFSSGKWLHETPANLTGFSYSHVLVLSPSNVWVAGSVAGTPELGHYDGHTWRALSMPGFVPATGMCRDGRGGLWVIANPGIGPSSVLDRSAVGSWTTVGVASTSAYQVLACAQFKRTTAAWGAGLAPAPNGSAAAVYGFGNVP